jgi:hypothetical protein
MTTPPPNPLFAHHPPPPSTSTPPLFDRAINLTPTTVSTSRAAHTPAREMEARGKTGAFRGPHESLTHTPVRRGPPQGHLHLLAPAPLCTLERTSTSGLSRKCAPNRSRGRADGSVEVRRPESWRRRDSLSDVARVFRGLTSSRASAPLLPREKTTQGMGVRRASATRIPAPHTTHSGRGVHLSSRAPPDNAPCSLLAPRGAAFTFSAVVPHECTSPCRPGTPPSGAFCSASAALLISPPPPIPSPLCSPPPRPRGHPLLPPRRHRPGRRGRRPPLPPAPERRPDPAP